MITRLGRLLAIPALILACLSLAGPARATSRVGPAPDLMEYLLGRSVLFVGKIEAIRSRPYQLTGMCSSDRAGSPVLELEIRPEEVLFGAGIRPQEIFYEDRRHESPLKVGDRLLLWGNRVCSVEWAFWGEVAILDSLGRLLPSEALHEFYPGWKRNHGRAPTLSDVRERVRVMSARLPDRPFLSPKGFDLAIVVKKSFIQPDTLVLACRRIRTLAGRAGNDTSNLRFKVPPQMPSLSIVPGDTLLVPNDEVSDRSVRDFATVPSYFKVDHGYLPGLGVPLSHFLDRFELHAGKYRLRDLVAEALK